MRKLALTAIAVGALSVVAAAPAEAHWRGGWGGPGIGLAVGALALGAAAAASPYYYGPRYAYYGPGYAYAPRYYYRPAPYAYYGEPVYYAPRYYRWGPSPYW